MCTTFIPCSILLLFIYLFNFFFSDHTNGFPNLSPTHNWLRTFSTLRSSSLFLRERKHKNPGLCSSATALPLRWREKKVLQLQIGTYAHYQKKSYALKLQTPNTKHLPPPQRSSQKQHLKHKISIKTGILIKQHHPESSHHSLSHGKENCKWHTCFFINIFIMTKYVFFFKSTLWLYFLAGNWKGNSLYVR